jgi:hypothetical protein
MKLIMIMIMITLDYDFLGYDFFVSTFCLPFVFFFHPTPALQSSYLGPWDRPQWEALKTAIAMDRNDVEALRTT